MPHFTSDHGWQGGGWGPWLTSYAMYANFLRFVGDDGIVMRELAAKAGAAGPVHPLYGGMRRWGYVTSLPDIAKSPKAKDGDALVRCSVVNGKPARERWAS